MAIIRVNKDGTYAQQRPLCGRVLTDPIYVTSHFMDDTTRRLYRYSDAAMHWDSYAAWPYHYELASLYFETACAGATLNAYWPVIGRSEGVLVRYGVAIDEVSVVLRKPGTEFRVPRGAWADWLRSGYVDSCEHPLEKEAVEEALPFLKTIPLP